jgi:hypothetical protein
LKKISLFLIALISCVCACIGKKETEKNEINDVARRFSGFAKAMEELNIDSMHGYTYPKLFTIVPLSTSKENIEKSYAVFKGKVKLDSVQIDTVYFIFHADKGNYAKIIYSLVITMPADSTEDSKNGTPPKTTSLEHKIGEEYAAPKSALMATIISGQFNAKVDKLDYSEGITTVHMKLMAVAVKDEYSKDWTFFTITADQELISKLFPKKVLEKLASHN